MLRQRFWGTTEAVIAPELARQLYRHTEHRGCYTRLDGASPEEARLLPPQELIEKVCAAMDMRVSRARRFDQVHHINLKELEEVKRELHAIVARNLTPTRCLNGTESNVG